MPFNLSVLKPLLVQPWRYTTQPTYDAQGVMLTPGVKQTPNGVFVLLSDDLVEHMKAIMTTAEKLEIAPWVNRYTETQAAMWNVPMWAGSTSAVYLRIPATEMLNPTDVPSLKIRRFFRELFRD